MTRSLDSYGLSLRGTRHETNHDQFAIAELNKSVKLQQSSLVASDERRVHGDVQGRVFLVADGLGHGSPSARASSAAVLGVVDYLVNDMPWIHLAGGSVDDVLDALEDAMRNARTELLRATDEHGPAAGTTLTLAFVVWPDLYVAHVGDSRCYVRREEGLELLTSTPEDTLQRTTVLWNTADSNGRPLRPAVRHTRLERDDVLLLATDGVLEQHDEETLREVLGREASAVELCRALVPSRGEDDRTAIVVRFLPEEPVTASLEAPPQDQSSVARPVPTRSALQDRRRAPRGPQPLPRSRRERRAAASAT